MSIHVSEKAIQAALAKYYREQGYSVQREVSTPVGYIDLIVHTPKSKLIVEVKEHKSVKHAIGQLLSYVKYHPDATDLCVVRFTRNLKYAQLDASYLSEAHVLVNYQSYNMHHKFITELIPVGDILECQDQRKQSSTQEQITYLNPLMEEVTQEDSLAELFM